VSEPVLEPARVSALGPAAGLAQGLAAAKKLGCAALEAPALSAPQTESSNSKAEREVTQSSIAAAAAR